MVFGLAQEVSGGDNDDDDGGDTNNDGEQIRRTITMVRFQYSFYTVFFLFRQMPVAYRFSIHFIIIYKLNSIKMGLLLMMVHIVV
jgi:hypothetical protein